MTVLGQQMAQPLVSLKTLLGESSSFQTLMVAADVAEAEAKVHYGYGKDLNEFLKNAEPDAATVFPRTIIALEDFSSSKTTTSSWSATIVISVLIEALQPDGENDLPARYFDFLARVEAVIDDVRGLTADLTRLNIQDIDTAVAPQRRPPKEQGNKPEVWYTVLAFGLKT